MATSTKTQVLQILRTAADYVSGQQICERLEISRTAVWLSLIHISEPTRP